MVTAVLASVCGSAAAAEPAKDWYVALKLGYQPYMMRANGEVSINDRSRDFDESASLADIKNNSDTTILGGEMEFGKGKWFTILSAFYQKSKVERGQDDPGRGVDLTFKETSVNALAGYRLSETRFGNGQALFIDGTAGVSYVKVKAEVDLHGPKIDNVDESTDISFVDPMFGARAYWAITQKFGIATVGQVGGFGIGSQLQYVASGSLVYNFTNWLAMSAGYKYWYFKFNDRNETLNHYEQTVKGPLVGFALRF
jgi:hypothetical protein